MEEQTEKSSEPPPEPSVTIQSACAVDIAWIEAKVKESVAVLNKPQSEISIRIVNDDVMSAMHLEHSGVEGTTDVLTFDNGGDNNTIDADIAVCVDVAKRTINACSHSVESELLLYIIHGLLHCIGYDDHNEEDHKKMHEEEDRILQEIGVGAIWSDGS
mgnify:FL=1